MPPTVEETTVSTDTAKPAIGRDAFTAARAQLQAQSQDPDPQVSEPPPADDTSTTVPAQETEKVADESPVTTESEDSLLPPDEVSKLDANARKQYDRMNKAFTTKTQALAAKTKQFDPWKSLIDGLTGDNPDAVIEELAKRRGLTIAKAAQDTTVDPVKAKLTKAIEKLPEDLRPLFSPFVDALAADLQGQLQPLIQAQSVMLSNTVMAETKAHDEAFAAKHADYRQVEPKMLELGQKILPTAGMATDEYMEILYTLAKAGQSKVEQVKETVKQINKSVAASEQRTTGVSEVRVEQSRPANWAEMTPKERWKASYEAAGRGVVWKD